MRDWKTDNSIENADHSWKDPILHDKFGITVEDWEKVIEQTVTHIQSWKEQTISERVTCIVDLLLPPLETLWQEKNADIPFRWLPCKSLLGATVADHSLTASAIAYCLGYDLNPRPDIDTLNKLRLSALTATWKNDGLDDVYAAIWGNESPIESNKEGTEYERIVFLAKTAASERIEIKDVQLDTHDLNQNKKIGLLLGGATKIKGYFLESAKLPEIRGASVLLDRINLEDVPALFGRKIEQDDKRYDDIRTGFCQRTGHTITAPECVIYAAGGNTLAFAPTSAVHHIADEIERIYTDQTLVANSVAIGDTFDLLELQYGLNPTQFWIDDFQKAYEDPKTAKLIENYYGREEKDFFSRKCFGELTSKLAGDQLKRREGNITQNRDTQRDLPVHVETDPYQVQCESCDRRPAVINQPKVLCEACIRKYVIGRITKKETEESKDLRGIDHYLKYLSDWEPASRNPKGGWCFEDWGSKFKNYLQISCKAATYHEPDPSLTEIEGPQDLEVIAKESKPENYIAFIYADGNNMGGYLENIASPAQYRQFSERVFIALQRAAFDALAEHLRPTKDNILPFEIISIGGDDLLLIVPGSKVFDIVNTVGKSFDNQFNSYAKLNDTNKDKLRKSQRYQSEKWVDEQEMQPVFSLSLGFVVAEEHTPVAFLEHIAHSLLKSAKSRAKTLIKEDVGYRGGTVDFLVLKSISMITSNLGDFRKNFYKTESENVLTMRPYTLNELSGFIQTVQTFKKGDFPRSQLYQLRESLLLGRSTSTLDYLYFRSRLDSDGGKLLKAQIERDWQGVSANNLGPWYEKLSTNGNDDKSFETLLFDLIEAYDFITKPEDSNKEDDSDKNNK